MEGKTKELQAINFENLLKLGYAVIDLRVRNYEVTNDQYKLVITQIDSDREDFYPSMLKHYLGKDVKDKNIYELWIKILYHKLKMSKILKRDISIKVAALDYIETQEKN